MQEGRKRRRSGGRAKRMRGIKGGSCRGAGSPWKGRKRRPTSTSSRCGRLRDGRMFARGTAEEGAARLWRGRRGSDSSSFQESVDTNEPGGGSQLKCLWVDRFGELVVAYRFFRRLQGRGVSREVVQLPGFGSVLWRDVWPGLYTATDYEPERAPVERDEPIWGRSGSGGSGRFMG